jgi:plastocyanin
MFAFLSLALALSPLVSAAIVDIQVGAAALTYSPEAIFAQPGDQVVFHFHAKNHTVTQSSFASPCGAKAGGISSGFMPVAANQTDNLPTFTVTVNDTNPIWIYCSQGANTAASHCGAGMVFSINCGPDGSANSFTSFKASALAIGASLKAAAAASSSAPVPSAPYPSAPAPAADPSAMATAAYGGYTIPPAPEATLVTQPITLDSTSTWTTTYSSYPGSPAPTPASAGGTVHTVIVGGPGKLAFDPPFLSALPRDTIVFQFQQKNHTVTQSSFEDPCRKLNNNGLTGFDSGFNPVADGAAEFPTFNFTVTDTSPVWAYCAQKTPSSHCGAGMVFAINSVETSARNFAAFQKVAEAINGTALAAVGPSAPSTGSTSAARSVKLGGAASVSMFLAALVGSIL